MDPKANKMLIDATHPEETRVVVLKNGRVEEFDYESASRKLLRGNIYLAKVTRVEPSLQAAFIDYGGNRHGFLAFSEIHPDYYQIPMADRQALIEEEAAAEAEADAEADARAEARSRGRRDDRRDSPGDGDQPAPHELSAHDHDAAAHDEAEAGRDRDHDHHRDDHAAHDHSHDEARAEPDQTGLHSRDDEALHAAPTEHGHHESDTAPRQERHHDDDVHADGNDGNDGANVEEIPVQPEEAPETLTSLSDEQPTSDALEELPERPRRQRRRHYKIQEVIKRRQILLVQVVKEERGNKGAALTTYLSLAGRYTVLMPNTGRGGGISRKITQAGDRRRLKEIAQELDVPEGMGLIIRTAGASRTNQEIRRDYEYLLRLWESVRDLTLESTAPSLVYEEGNLIKRSIRDQYTKDIDEVVVAGATAHREAYEFMRMLMPSQVKNVILHDRPEPLFSRYPIVERQLNAMFSPYVTLRSGGYLVINQTEALVAIDINSGKSTREFSIEETALNTNLEAADEIARQLKLRDLAGLIVVDFIDMEERRNNRKVENRMKDALRHDRARIQVGRISHFGLLEMSRQRMRTGVLEGSTSQCPHCQGTGIIRSVESVSLAVLRGLEDHLQRDARSSVNVLTSAEVALYILNHKRNFIVEMERRFGVSVAVSASDRMQGANFAVEKSSAPLLPKRGPQREAVTMNSGFSGNENEAIEPGSEEDDPRPASVADARGEEAVIDDVGDDEDEDRGEPRERSSEGHGRNGEDGRGGRRRRRRGRGRDRDRSGGDRSGGDREGGPREGRHAGASDDPVDASRDDDRPRGGERGERPGRGERGDRPGRGERDDRPARTDHDDGLSQRDPGDESAVEAGEAGDDRDRGDGNNSRRSQEGEGDGEGRRRRRRGRRGGRRRDRDGDPRTPESASFEGSTPGHDQGAEHEMSSGNGADHETGTHHDSGPDRTSVTRDRDDHRHTDDRHAGHDRHHVEPQPALEPYREPVAARPSSEPVRSDAGWRGSDAPVEPQKPREPIVPELPPVPKEIIVESSTADPAKPTRRGWWSRR